ncbi:putative spermidine/putrescine transport system permease protein [Peptoniphilus asaccharolyticus DSM 20463]|uniref:Putative spermidine/putrescine transport system permease protein n=1 Tax=Peptoniphilus asaccharolyticus DSM 20463 TaxID=573058 RepID=A0A1W1VLJ2_PEPAS|nr:ABC transporter permease subunit [Peptoniphilus asaccharolyticus]MBL7574511.1 ABC transporter permease subunit [Peptoniphilus asaccharolyticus]SMB94198.1 putative spermidine/putrescine transport system permease protein [Peptoniphilus asaccharolyticus DSM 20463]
MHKRFLGCRLILWLTVIAIVLPIFILIVWSFTNNYMWPNIFPSSYGLRGWKYVFQNSNRVLNALRNSFIISMFTTVITLIISIPCARALAFEEFKGKKLVEVLVLSPLVIPSVSIGMGLNIQFIKLGLARTFTGIVLVSIVPCIPYAVRMIEEVFRIVGQEHFKQAKVLGADNIYIFKKIVVPLLLPGILSSGMMCYIISFSQYFLAYLIGGGKIITFTMEMFPFIQSGDRMMGSVYGIIFIFSTMFFLIAMELIIKYFYKKEIEDYYV